MVDISAITLHYVLKVMPTINDMLKKTLVTVAATL